MDLGIEYYINSSGGPIEWSAAIVYLIFNNISDNRTVGNFTWTSQVTGYPGIYAELTPTWTPNLSTGYYNIFLEVHIFYQGNITFTNLSTFPNSDPSSRISSTPEVPRIANSIVGWAYSNNFTNLALTYPSSTLAFSFSYSSSYPVSFDSRPQSNNISTAFLFILPSQVTFYMQTNPNIPNISFPGG